jgi:superfamily I DNA and/or RNA helicase
MVGKDINRFPAARHKAQRQISESRLIFTTCVGAGLGLLRNESFGTVVIDEASQQTEPASLIPLVKGCQRAVLVGDHVQLRATVHPHAQLQGLDVSLFERLWTSEENGQQIHKVMLNVQYRMHPSLCTFPSDEFYNGKLLTGEACHNIPLPESLFTWPEASNQNRTTKARCVFIQCSHPEDLGQKSKSNEGQAKVCQEVLRRLTSPPSPPPPHTSPTPSITILTPYTRQATLLRRLCPPSAAVVSSIDGFQGQEADLIIYVTVRCNVHAEIGFLKDLRRMNVALTRARAGIIVVGDRATLTGKCGEEESCRVWERWIRDAGKGEVEVVC